MRKLGKCDYYHIESLAHLNFEQSKSRQCDNCDTVSEHPLFSACKSYIDSFSDYLKWYSLSGHGGSPRANTTRAAVRAELQDLTTPNTTNESNAPVNNSLEWR